MVSEVMCELAACWSPENAQILLSGLLCLLWSLCGLDRLIVAPIAAVMGPLTPMTRNISGFPLCICPSDHIFESVLLLTLLAFPRVSHLIYECR